MTTRLTRVPSTAAAGGRAFQVTMGSNGENCIGCGGYPISQGAGEAPAEIFQSMTLYMLEKVKAQVCAHTRQTACRCPAGDPPQQEVTTNRYACNHTSAHQTKLIISGSP